MSLDPVPVSEEEFNAIGATESNPVAPVPVSKEEFESTPGQAIAPGPPPEDGGFTRTGESIKGLMSGSMRYAQSVFGTAPEVAGQAAAQTYDAARAPKPFPGMTEEQWQEIVRARQAQQPTPNPLAGHADRMRQYTGDFPESMAVVAPHEQATQETAPYYEMRPVDEMGPVSRTLGRAATGLTDIIRAPQPFPGMTAEQWQEIVQAREAQQPTENIPVPQMGRAQQARLAREVGEMAPNMAPSVGAAVATGGLGPAAAGAAFLTGGGLEALSEYDQAIQEGATPEEAMHRFSVMFPLAGVLNYIPFSGAAIKFLPPRLRNRVIQGLIAGPLEGVTEMSEGGVAAIGKMENTPQSREEWKSAFLDVARGVWNERSVFLAATLLGTGMGAVSPSEAGRNAQAERLRAQAREQAQAEAQAELEAMYIEEVLRGETEQASYEAWEEEVRRVGREIDEAKEQRSPEERRQQAWEQQAQAPLPPTSDSRIASLQEEGVNLPQEPTGVRQFPPLTAGPPRQRTPNLGRVEPLGKEFAPTLPEAPARPIEEQTERRRLGEPLRDQFDDPADPQVRAEEQRLATLANRVREVELDPQFHRPISSTPQELMERHDLRPSDAAQVWRMLEVDLMNVREPFSPESRPRPPGTPPPGSIGPERGPTQPPTQPQSRARQLAEGRRARRQERERPRTIDIESSPIEDIRAFIREEDAKQARKEREVAERFLSPEKAAEFNQIPDTAFGERQKTRMMREVSEDAVDALDDTAVADTPEIATQYRQASILLDRLNDTSAISPETAVEDVSRAMRQTNFRDPIDVRAFQEMVNRLPASGVIDVPRVLSEARQEFRDYYELQTRDPFEAEDQLAMLDEVVSFEQPPSRQIEQRPTEAPQTPVETPAETPAPAPRPTPSDRKRAKDKVDKHGLTREQKDFLTNELRDQWQSLPVSEKDATADSIRIKVPGDGTFTINSQRAANAMHKRLTGQWLDESTAREIQRDPRLGPASRRVPPERSGAPTVRDTTPVHLGGGVDPSLERRVSEFEESLGEPLGEVAQRQREQEAAFERGDPIPPSRARDLAQGRVQGQQQAPRPLHPEEKRFSKGLESEITERLQNSDNPDLTRTDVLREFLEDMDIEDTIAYDFRRELRDYAIEIGAAHEVTQADLDRRIVVGGGRQRKAKPDFKHRGKMYDFPPGDPFVGVLQPSAPQAPAEVQSAVRSAYLEDTGGQFETRVRLADLREKLPDVPREQLDATLLEMQQAGDLVLYPLDDPMDTTQRDRDARLMLGNDPRDLVYMKPTQAPVAPQEARTETQATQTAPETQEATRAPRASVPLKGNVQQEIARMLPPEAARFSEETGMLDFEATFDATSNLQDAINTAIENSDNTKARKGALKRSADSLMTKVFQAQEKAEQSTPQAREEAPESGRRRPSDESGFASLDLLFAPFRGVMQLIVNPPRWEHKRGFTGKAKKVKQFAVEREGRINELKEAATHINNDLRRATTKAYGVAAQSFNDIPARDDKTLGKFLSEPDRNLKNQYLNQLPEPMREVAVDMRNFIDSISGQMRSMGLIGGKAAGVVKSKDGFYVREVYRIFTEPEIWNKDTIPQKIKDAAFDWIQTESRYKDSPLELQKQALTQFMSIGEYTPEKRGNALGKLLGTTDLGDMHKNIDYPKPLTDLWGLEDRGSKMFSETAVRLTHTFSNLEFAKRFLDEGRGKFIWTKEDQDNRRWGDPGEFERSVRIEQPGRTKTGKDTVPITELLDDGEGNITTLFGKDTVILPEVKEALERAVETTTPNALIREIAFWNYLGKILKTKYNWMGQMRNAQSSQAMTFMSGEVTYGGEQGRLKREALAARITQAGLDLKKDKEARELRRDMVRRGVLLESTAKELTELKREGQGAYSQRGIEVAVNTLARTGQIPKRFVKSAKDADDITQNMYIAGDDFARSFAYLTQVDMGKEVLKLSDDAARERAAELVRAKYPSYSENHRWVQLARYNPAFAPFPSFVAAMPRAYYNSYVDAHQMMRNADPDPEVRTAARKQGRRQMASLAAITSLPAAVTATSAMLYGLSGDDQEDITRFMPPWDKNGAPAWRAVDRKAGKFAFIQQAYTDPVASIKEPFKAALRADNPRDGMLAFIEAGIAPYVGREMAFKAMEEIGQNRTTEGYPIWNDADTVQESAEKVIKHLGKGAFSIPTVKELLRARGSDSPWTITTGVITGQKTVEVDVPKALMWNARAYATGKNANVYDVKQAMEAMNITDFDEQVRQLENHRRHLFNSLVDDYNAAIRLMGPGAKQTLINQMKEGGVAEKEIPLILRNIYREYVPSDRRDNISFQRMQRGLDPLPQR